MLFSKKMWNKNKKTDFLFPTLQFGVCDIQKCGSTSWLQAVLVMEDYYNHEDFFADRIRGEEVMELANKQLRFSSVNVYNTSLLYKWQNAVKVTRVT